MNNNSNPIMDVDFSKLLTLALIILKLCKVIDLSWIWVLSPLWICALIELIVVIIIVKRFK